MNVQESKEMLSKAFVNFLFTIILFWGITAFSQSSDSIEKIRLSDTTLFDNSIWAVNGGSDTGQNSRDIKVYVQGQFVGNFSELKILHFMLNLGFPQIFSIKGNGALRPTIPQGEFGGTFYATGYWDSDSGFIQTMPILELDIQLNPVDTTILQFSGNSSNLITFEAPDFTLNVFPPSLDSVKVDVLYSLITTNDFNIDTTRQIQHEGFKIARIASNYISTQINDSDQARYIDTLGMEICVDLVNEDGFIFTDSSSLFPMGESDLYLINTDSLPRNTPTLILKFLQPDPKFITPQGFVTYSIDPDDDNVDFWGNWESVEAAYNVGDTIGIFIYTLLAIPPEPICGIIGLSDATTHIMDYALNQNYPNPFNPITTISYQLHTSNDVELTIYNILGQRVKSLVDEKQPAGFYQVRWDGKNEKNQQVSSGIYFYRLRAGSFVHTKKMILLR